MRESWQHCYFIWSRLTVINFFGFMINKTLILKKGEKKMEIIFLDILIRDFSGMLKGNWRPKSAIFPTFFFAKFNISEVNFVKLFSLVYCFFARKLHWKLDFSHFATSSLWAQKTKSAACCDVWYGEEGFRDQEKHLLPNREPFEHPTAQQFTIMASRGNERMLLYGPFSHVFPISYVISCKNDRWLFHSEPQCWWPKIGIKIFFRWKNDRYARKKVENIIVRGLKWNKKL